MENEFEVKMTDVELEELGLLDLDNTEDLEKIEEQIGSGFFNPEHNKTYKINLTDSKTQFVIREFENEDKKENVQKIKINILATDKSKNEFKGIWECGYGTFRKIMKIIKESDKKTTETSFKMTKSGSGINTRYDIVADDF